MANTGTLNDFTNVIPQLLAQSLEILRAKAIMPALVNRVYEPLAGNRGTSIEVPVPAPQAVYDLEPSNVPTDTLQGFSPGTISIPLDQWKGSSFTLNDKEMLEIQEGTAPRQAQQAMASLANYIDKYILGLYKKCPNVVGIAGITPFITAVGATGTDNSQENFDKVGNSKIVTEAARVLNDEYAPMNDRRVVLNPATQAAALNIRAFQDLSWAADPAVIRAGDLGGASKFGFSFFMNQNILVHTSGGASILVGAAKRKTNGSLAVGADFITVDAHADGDFVEGDVISFAGDTKTYVVTKDSDSTRVDIFPALEVAKLTDTIITVLPTHTVNLAFQQDAITFVNRPMGSQSITQGQTSISTALDTESGLALRLEVTRQSKQIKWEFDVLFGGQVLRPEHVVRVLA